MLEKDYDVLANATYVADNQWHTGVKSTLLFRRLLENNDFKLRFSNRVNELCNSVLQNNSTTAILDGIVQDLRLEVPNQVARFGYPENMDYWNWACSLSRDFLVNRVADYQEFCENFEPLKIHDYQSNTDDFVLYPNPTGDVVHIRMLDGRSRETSFLLCDAMGRVILGGKSYLSACQEIVLGSELCSGVYIVKIGPYVHKFVKL